MDDAVKQEEKYTFADPMTEHIDVLRERLSASGAEHELAMSKQADELGKKYNELLASVHRPPWTRTALIDAMRVMALVLHFAWFIGTVIAGVIVPCLVIAHRLPARCNLFIIMGVAMIIVQYFVLRLESETK